MSKSKEKPMPVTIVQAVEKHPLVVSLRVKLANTALMLAILAVVVLYLAYR